MSIAHPPYQKLRVPSNWCIHRTKFLDLSPDAEPKFKRFPHDDGWTSFEQELLYVEYKDGKFTLDMGWIDPYSPSGKFMLGFVKDDRWREEEIINKTRSLQEVTQAINDTMLKISLENGDYPNYPTGLQLQDFTPSNYIRYIRHEFFDIEPSANLTTEEWQLFKEEMFLLQPYRGADWRIEAGWFPAFDPAGHYRVKASLEESSTPLFDVLETESKAEIVDYINNVFKVHLPKLYEIQNKREKSEKERQRQAKLREQRNQKV